MKCEYCGKDTPDGLDFCTKCGRAFKKSSARQDKSKAKYFILAFVIFLIFAIAFAICFSTDNLMLSPKKRAENTSEKETVQKSDAENDTVYTIVENPHYKVLENKKYGVHIEYPDHFIVNDTKSEQKLLDLKDPNNAANLLVLGFTDISANSENVSDLLKSELYKDKNAVLLDEKCTDNRIYQKHKLDSVIIQTSCIISEHSVCILTFSYAEFEAHVYDKYFAYINEHFTPIDE